MATLFSATMLDTNATAADFRAWCSFIHNTFTLAGCWVNTADTGQMDLATVAAPTITNEKKGYKIYRMDDALQAFAPVFVRVDFGCTTALVPGIWIQIGQGSDGAGNLTSVRMPNTAGAAPMIFSATSATVHDCYGSAGPDRVHISLFNAAGAVRPMLFSIERIKDVNGVSTTAGLYVCWNHVTNALSKSRYVALGTSMQPIEEIGLQFVLGQPNPSSFDGNIGIGLLIPMRGIAQPPATGVILYRSNDFIAGAQVRIVLYEQSMLYQNVGYGAFTGYTSHTAGALLLSDVRIAFRFD